MEVTLPEVLETLSQTDFPKGDYSIFVGGGLVKRGITAPCAGGDVDTYIYCPAEKDKCKNIIDTMTKSLRKIPIDNDYVSAPNKNELTRLFTKYREHDVIQIIDRGIQTNIRRPWRHFTKNI